MFDKSAPVPLQASQSSTSLHMLKQAVDSPRSNAERRRLIHVEPDARELDSTIGPVRERLRPEGSCVLGEPIREDLSRTPLSVHCPFQMQRDRADATHSVSGPHLAHVLRPVRVFDPNIPEILSAGAPHEEMGEKFTSPRHGCMDRTAHSGQLRR